MIETRYPGVYVSEIPTHAHPIEGVSTSTKTEYPGVYLTEIPTNAHPIDGVSTTTAPSSASAEAPAASAPAWTDANQSDPGVTLLQLFAFLAESILYRANLVPQRAPRHLPDAPAPASDGSTPKIRKP